MSKFGPLPALVAAGLIATLAADARPAHATFPGPTGRIAFDSARSAGTGNIFTMKPDGSDVRQLTFLTAGAAVVPAWSPDGRSIAFEEYTADFSSAQIILMNADGSNQRVLFSDPGYQDILASFSPDGSRVVFSRCSGPREACAIYAIKTDGHGLNALTHFNQTVNDFDLNPKYAPDGRTVAFGSFNRGGVQVGVYLMDAHGAGIRQLTPSALEAWQPDWSPDGAALAVVSNCCIPQSSAIWRVRPDGSGLQQLTFPGDEHDRMPSYSPQGDQIAFERDTADSSSATIMTMGADGSAPTPIQPDASDPSWGSAGS
jgi:Tol biopolymer transport system component